MKLSQLKCVNLDPKIVLKEKRFLITGKVGAGKTETAKAIAEELNAITYMIDCPNLQTDDLQEILENVKTRSLHKKEKIIIADEIHLLASRLISKLLVPLNDQDIRFIGCSSRSRDEIMAQSDQFLALCSRLSYAIHIEPNANVIESILIADYGFNKGEAEYRSERCDGDIRLAINGNEKVFEKSFKYRTIAKDPEAFVFGKIDQYQYKNPDFCIELLTQLDRFKNNAYAAKAIALVCFKHKIKVQSE